MPRLSARSSALATLLLSAPALASPTATGSTEPARREAFAYSLLVERDYFRAISEYKRLAFMAPAATDRHRYWLTIARAYQLGDRQEHAILSLARLRAQKDIAAPWLPHIDAAMAWSYLRLRLPQVAHPMIDRALRGRATGTSLDDEARLLNAIASVQSDELETAGEGLAHLARSRASHVRESSERLQQLLLRHDAAPTRSAWLAGGLSLVLPGAGQAYTGHWVDGMQALAYVGSFAFATFLAYRYETSEGNPYVLTSAAAAITLTLHGANVLGAVRTAHLYDYQRRNALLDGAHRELPAALPSLPPWASPRTD